MVQEAGAKSRRKKPQPVAMLYLGRFKQSVNSIPVNKVHSKIVTIHSIQNCIARFNGNRRKFPQDTMTLYPYE
jgi:hypothetical protein